MPSPTAGFELSALPQAAQWPTNLGTFDPMKSIQTAQASADLGGNLRTIGARTQEQLAQLKEQTAQAQAGTLQAQNTQTSAGLQGQALARAGQTPVEAGVLNYANELAKVQAENVGLRANQLLYQQAAKESAGTPATPTTPATPSLAQEHAAAMAIPDYQQRATALSQIQLNHRWLSLLPYKEQADSIEKDRQAAQTMAEKQMEGLNTIEASRVRSENAAKTGATSREAVAETNADSREAVANIHALSPDYLLEYSMRKAAEAAAAGKPALEAKWNAMAERETAEAEKLHPGNKAGGALDTSKMFDHFQLNPDGTSKTAISPESAASAPGAAPAAVTPAPGAAPAAAASPAAVPAAQAKMATNPAGGQPDATPISSGDAAKLPSGTWFMGTDNRWRQRI